MIGISQSITETFKQIIESLQIRYIIPAVNFTLFSIIISPLKFEIRDPQLITIVSAFTIILSILLSAFNGLIIRFAEGYLFKDKFFFRLTQIIEIKRFINLQNQIEYCQKRLNEIENYKENLAFNEVLNDKIESALKIIDEKWKVKKDRLIGQLRYRFPISKENLLPTALGNAISAFENYPAERYNIDAVYLWPRMLPILREKNYLTFVQKEKTTMDFLLNTCLVCILLSLETLIVFGIYEHNFQYLLVILGFLIFTYLLYCAAIYVAIDWGIMVCTAFDLYRNDLRKALYLEDIPMGNLKSEKQIWRAISQFIIFGKSDNLKGFYY